MNPRLKPTLSDPAQLNTKSQEPWNGSSLINSSQMKWLRNALKNALSRLKGFARIDIRVVAAALVAVGILHICATLASPHLVESSAYTRLKPLLQPNKMKILAPVRPGAQPIPFLSADFRYAMCRFNSTTSPITVTAYLPDKGWSIAIHTPQGDNLYTATGQEAHTSIITLQLVASKTSFSGLTPESLGVALTDDPIQIVEAPYGIAILRAPDRGSAYARNTILAMRRAKCFPVQK